MTPIAESSACQNPKAPIGVTQERPRTPPAAAQPTAAADKDFSAISGAFGLKIGVTTVRKCNDFDD